MKIYKIQSTPETEIILSEIDIRNLLKENPELLTPTPTHKRKYFVPRDGETFYYIDNAFCDVRESKYEQHREFSKFCVESGNSFRTMEDGYDELNRRQSLVKIWNNYDDKYSWDIDWEDRKQEKYEIIYNHSMKEFFLTYEYTDKQTSTELPYFKSAEDRNQFVEENESDLLIIFNIKK